MTSIPQRSNTPAQTNISGAQATVEKQSPSASLGPISTAPAVGRSSYAAATKNSISPNASRSSSMATAIEGSMPSQHGNGETIPPVNGNIPIIAAIPSLEASAGVNGNNNFSAGPAPDHSRKPSFTVTPSGINGGPSGSQPNKANNIQFGSVNSMNMGGSPASGTSPALTNPSPANLGVAGPVNPRMTSPQASPSPIPRPVISGGRPPSSLQNQGNNLIFGQSGPEASDPNV
jgi:translation initiation factor 4G